MKCLTVYTSSSYNNVRYMVNTILLISIILILSYLTALIYESLGLPLIRFNNRSMINCTNNNDIRAIIGCEAFGFCIIFISAGLVLFMMCSIYFCREVKDECESDDDMIVIYDIPNNELSMNISNPDTLDMDSKRHNTESSNNPALISLL